MNRSPTPTSRTGEISPGFFVQGLRYSTWRPHGSGDWLLIFTVDGAGKILHPDGSFITSSGELLLYEPETTQDYRTDPDTGTWALYWAHFLPRPHWQQWLREIPTAFPGLRSLALPEGEVRRHILEAWEDMLASWRGSLFNSQAFSMNALEKALLWVHTVLAQDPWPGLDSRIRQVMRFMEQTLEHPPTQETLAKSCGLSVSRFAHLFREETGLTPQRFQESLRMNKARQLLESTSLRIGEIASETGYEDPLYFSNRFKKWSGFSPSTFREAARGRGLQGS